MDPDHERGDGPGARAIDAGDRLPWVLAGFRGRNRTILELLAAGRTRTEVAASLGVSREAVTRRLDRTRSRLEGRLKQGRPGA